MQISVGCCGFVKSIEKYFKEFKLVEIQQTFYKLPKIETVQKWVRQAPKDFEFSVKCFQGVTHTIYSPTWKRSGIKDLKKLENKVGFLKPTKEVFEFWNKTLEICKILASPICLIQLPSSFKENSENIKNAEKFFSKIKRNNISIVLELRGWDENKFKKICKRFNLISCVDPFKSEPLYFSKKKIAYFRLHGSYDKRGKINYNYKYTRKDLYDLKRKIESLKVKKVYILFNNIWMYDNAQEFIKIIS